MRELWVTGWMHNRVRMIVASFLVKDLLAPWQEGARWFWETLVDADLAQNTLGWQWTAGCGAMRLLISACSIRRLRPKNLIPRASTFDVGASRVGKTAVTAWLHKPEARATPEVLKQAGVNWSKCTLSPIVSHRLMLYER
jgi:deoxyribodipyrimidine photo-lyase